MLVLRRLLLSMMLLSVPVSETAAHSLRAPRDTSGISIPSLSHGQMEVVARHREEIHALASWVAVKDAEIRKLLAFSRTQFARCLWGLMPFSIQDEASPMNECSHAYLAADRAMLVRMRDLPFWQDRSRSLFDAVDIEMVEEGSSLVLCIFSATDFNTASPVGPDWHDFIAHRPSLIVILLAGGTVMAVLALGTWTVFRRPRLAAA